MKNIRLFVVIFAGLLYSLNPVYAQDGPSISEKISYAESAGIPEIASESTILDGNGDVLREGSNGWTCMYVPEAPMCLDQEWMAMLGAMMGGNMDHKVTKVGLSYMLQGDGGASNTNPAATGPTADNHWVVTGPHIMLISPDPSALSGIPSEPSGGGPYVMWGGTPFAHVMIPVVEGAVSMAGTN